jgi:hypothetical protein
MNTPMGQHCGGIVRRRLPNRREHWTIEFEHGGIRYTAGVGRFGDEPGADLAEIFFNVPGKSGTTLENHARDEAIAASLALQFGCPVDVLRGALTRNADGSPSGALGRLLTILRDESGLSAAGEENASHGLRQDLSLEETSQC